MMPHAIVVDDESQMLSIIAFALETQGFTVQTARTAEAAWALMQHTHVDLVVLDITLPGMSGLQLAERIRATSTTPILMLTARAAPDDRIAGLLAGADDYLTKPFSPRELALRAQAIVRRSVGAQGAMMIVNGPLQIDVARQRAWIAGEPLRLSDVEFRFLATLARHPGVPVSTSTLLNEVWLTSEHVGARDLIKTTVYRLRQRLGTSHDWITSVRGHGYVMPDLGHDD